MSNLSATLYRDLLEFAPDALIVINAEGTIIYANAHAHTLFGYEPGRMNDLPIERLIPEQARAAHVAHRNAYIADPRTREMGNRGMALFGQRQDGSRFRAEIRLAPIRTPDGIVSAAAVRDATESERIMNMLAAAKETADEANATKGRFLAAASHDLRQPLQTLRLLNGTLKRLAREPMMREVLDQEERALGTMSELLNALLNVTKLESGTVHPSLSEVLTQCAVRRPATAIRESRKAEEPRAGGGAICTQRPHGLDAVARNDSEPPGERHSLYGCRARSSQMPHGSGPHLDRSRG